MVVIACASLVGSLEVAVQPSFSKAQGIRELEFLTDLVEKEVKAREPNRVQRQGRWSFNKEVTVRPKSRQGTCKLGYHQVEKPRQGAQFLDKPHLIGGGVAVKTGR